MKDAAYLLTLPRAERSRIMAAGAESAVPWYEADLAIPVSERELTAFTALDGEPFLEHPDVRRLSLVCADQSEYRQWLEQSVVCGHIPDARRLGTQHE